MRRRRAATIAVLVALCAAPARAPAAAGDDAAIKALLEKRGTAVARDDASAFDETMSGAPSEYLDRERTWFRRIHRLPLQTYRLAPDEGEFGDLARTKDKQGFDDVRVIQVKERIGFRGYDMRPSNEDVFLSVARRGDRWFVAGDAAVEDLGLLSMRNLWDFGDIDVAERDGIMVVHHPAQADAVGPIQTQAAHARARAKRGWPLPWNQPIIIMVPSSVSELGRILQTTFDLSSFVAFAASSVERDTGWKLSGNRVFLHWPNFKKYSSSFQEQVLSHEFTHLATRDIAGPFVTAFMDEGIAQHYGEGGGETVQLRRRVRNHTLPGSLVPDWYFTAGPRDDIFLAYEEAASFIKYLTKRFGSDAGARAYRALGTIDPVTAGTWRYHLDRVTQSLFKLSFPALEKGWYQSVSKELS